MRNRNRNLSSGNVTRQLFSLTWPMLFGMMGMVIFNLVDTYFVGKLGVQQLAAISFSFPVVIFINSFAHGIGIGTSSLISRNIIHTEREVVKMMASRAIFLGVAVVLVFATVGLITVRPLFSALGAKNEVLDYIESYMKIWYFGVPFVVIPMVGNNIIRATGDTFTPGMVMVAIAMINAILDPMLIFGYGPFPEMGMRGAALATVIARGTGLVVVLFILVKREKLFTLRIGRFKNIISTWKSVLYIAGPASLTMLITPISAGFLTRILAGFGKEAVAAFGVASRVEMLALMVIAALGSVMIIFVGQNLSKHQYQRISKALNLSLRFSMIWGVVIFILLLLAGQSVASVFTSNTRVIEIIRNYFYIIGASYGLQGLVIISTSAFNGLNKPHPSAFFSIIRMLLLYVPLAWLGSRIFNTSGVFWAGFVANLIAGPLSFSYLFKSVRIMKGNLPGSNINPPGS